MKDQIEDALATFVVAIGSHDANSGDLAIRRIDRFIYEAAALGEDPLTALRALEAAYLKMKLDSATGKAIHAALRMRIGLMIINARSHKRQAAWTLTTRR